MSEDTDGGRICIGEQNQLQAIAATSSDHDATSSTTVIGIDGTAISTIASSHPSPQVEVDSSTSLLHHSPISLPSDLSSPADSNSVAPAPAAAAVSATNPIDSTTSKYDVNNDDRSTSNALIQQYNSPTQRGQQGNATGSPIITIARASPTHAPLPSSLVLVLPPPLVDAVNAAGGPESGPSDPASALAAAVAVGETSVEALAAVAAAAPPAPASAYAGTAAGERGTLLQQMRAEADAALVEAAAGSTSAPNLPATGTLSESVPPPSSILGTSAIVSSDSDATAVTPNATPTAAASSLSLPSTSPSLRPRQLPSQGFVFQSQADGSISRYVAGGVMGAGGGGGGAAHHRRMASQMAAMGGYAAAQWAIRNQQAARKERATMQQIAQTRQDAAIAGVVAALQQPHQDTASATASTIGVADQSVAAPTFSNHAAPRSLAEEQRHRHQLSLESTQLPRRPSIISQASLPSSSPPSPKSATTEGTSAAAMISMPRSRSISPLVGHHVAHFPDTSMNGAANHASFPRPHSTASLVSLDDSTRLDNSSMMKKFHRSTQRIRLDNVLRGSTPLVHTPKRAHSGKQSRASSPSRSKPASPAPAPAPAPMDDNSRKKPLASTSPTKSQQPQPPTPMKQPPVSQKPHDSSSVELAQIVTTLASSMGQSSHPHKPCINTTNVQIQDASHPTAGTAHIHLLNVMPEEDANSEPGSCPSFVRSTISRCHPPRFLIQLYYLLLLLYQWTSGTMPAFYHWTQSSRRSHPVLWGFLSAFLRAWGQVVFQNNPVSGACIILAMLLNDVWVGVVGLVATLVATILAKFLGLNPGAYDAGLFGYNAVLIGLALATFDVAAVGPWNVRLLGPVILLSAFSTLVLVALSNVLVEKFNVPPLTLPFNLCAGIYLIGALQMTYFSVPFKGAAADLPSPPPRATEAISIDWLQFARGIITGIGQVFLASNFTSGWLVLVGILICSPCSALFAALGSLVGGLTALGMGVDPSDIYLGLWGYNSVLGGIAIGGFFFLPNLTASMFAIFCAIICSMVQATLGVLFQAWGDFPTLTFPFCVVTLSFLLLHTSIPNRLIPIPLVILSYPEEHRKRFLVHRTFLSEIRKTAMICSVLEEEAEERKERQRRTMGANAAGVEVDISPLKHAGLPSTLRSPASVSTSASASTSTSSNHVDIHPLHQSRIQREANAHVRLAKRHEEENQKKELARHEAHRVYTHKEMQQRSHYFRLLLDSFFDLLDPAGESESLTFFQIRASLNSVLGTFHSDQLVSKEELANMIFVFQKDEDEEDEDDGDSYEYGKHAYGSSHPPILSDWTLFLSIDPEHVFIEYDQLYQFFMFQKKIDWKAQFMVGEDMDTGTTAATTATATVDVVHAATNPSQSSPPFTGMNSRSFGHFTVVQDGAGQAMTSHASPLETAILPLHHADAPASNTLHRAAEEQQIDSSTPLMVNNAR